jgi:hypothetical protein
MAFLIGLLLVVGACYSPDLPDCRVRCETVADCAPGQSCTDHACSGTTLCPSDALPPGPDDAADAVDAAAIDGPPADAALGVLAVKIEDKGSVSITGGGSCTDMAPDHTCMFGVVLGTVVTLHASPGMDRVFVMWTESCTGTNSTCLLTPTAGMTQVTAKFHKDD